MLIKTYAGKMLQSDQIRLVPVSGKYHGRHVETTVPVAVTETSIVPFWPPGWCLSEHVSRAAMDAFFHAQAQKKLFFCVETALRPSNNFPAHIELIAGFAINLN